ncbi:DUF397 domain-containing protein [Amycolatopsis sp. NPDC004772]
MEERVRRKSSYSDKTDCVQVGFPTSSDPTCEIDDTKDPGPSLVMSREMYVGFLAAVKPQQ